MSVVSGCVESGVAVSVGVVSGRDMSVAKVSDFAVSGRLLSGVEVSIFAVSFCVASEASGADVSVISASILFSEVNSLPPHPAVFKAAAAKAAKAVFKVVCEERSPGFWDGRGA